MAEQVNIASLTINTEDLVKESTNIKKVLDSLKNTQKELKKSGEESSEAFVENEIQIKKLSKAYKDNKEFATALDSANEDLNKTMSSQNKSTQELRDSRSQLNKISKNIKGDTEEEIALRNQLNDAIDEQTDKIREQSSNFNKNKDRVGEYKDSIIEAVHELTKQKEVLEETQLQLQENLSTLDEGTKEYTEYSQALVIVNSDLDKVNDSLKENGDEFDANILSISGFVDESQKSGGAMKALTSGVKAGTKAIFGMTKAAVGFILTPLGLAAITIAGAFLLIQNAMNRSEESTTKIKKAFSAFTGIVKGVLKALQPLGDFLIDYVVWYLELVEKGVYKAAEAMTSFLKFVGLDSAAKKLENFNEGIKETVKASKELTQAELDFQKAQRESRKLILDSQKAAEKLRQVRDNETKNIYTRIKANEQLGKVLDKQLNDELALAQKALNFANLRVQLEGETKEALDARAEAETEIADIQERIVGQQSEQLVNRVALQKEAAEKAIASQQAELDSYIQANGVRAKSLADSLKVEAEIATQKEDILKRQLQSKLITQREYDAELLNLQNDLARKQAELSADNAKRELEAFIENNQTKIDKEKFLSKEIVAEEKKRLQSISDARKEEQAVRLEEGIISEQEYNDAILLINKESNEQLTQLNIEAAEAEKLRVAENANNISAILENELFNQFETKKRELERQQEAEIEAAEKTGADTYFINKKYASLNKQLEEEAAKAKLEINKQTLGSVAELLGEQTIAGKAAGIALSTINAYQGVTEVWKAPAVLPEPFNTASKLAASATTIASGLAAVNKIKSTPVKFSKGDILSGARHANGGIQFSVGGKLGFEAEGGEALINRKSTAKYRPLLSAINVAEGGKKFAGGGIAGSGAGSISSSIIDIDALALGIAETFEYLPVPEVSVTEIARVSNNVSVIETLSTD